MKTRIFKMRSLLAGLVGLLFTAPAYSQFCAGNGATLSIANFVQTSTTIEFDVNVTFTTSVQNRFNSYGGNVIYNSGMLPAGATGTFTVVDQPNSAQFPGIAASTVAPAHNLAARSLRWTFIPGISPAASAPVMSQNTVYKFARFRFTSTLPWVQGFTGALTFNTISGGGNPLNIVNVYCSTNSASTPISLANSNLTLATGQTQNTPFNFILNPASGPTASVLSGDANICAGASTNLSVAVTGGTSPYTVTVTDGTNNYSATGASPVSIAVSPTSTSTYSIVSVTGGGTGTGNSGSATVTVTAAPAQPTLACYQAATFNTATCSWDVTGTQPAEPTTALACYQTRTFNGAVGVCAWEVSGTQPVEPTTALACYQTRTFNGAVGVCAWEVSGTQPAQPTTACYQTATFNGCTWDLTGTQQTNTIPVTAVGTYTWANNGQTYSASGTYTGNVVNCVIQVLNLTITPVQSGVLSLKVYLEGYYLSGGQMRSALANSGVGTNNAISDTIKVQLRSQSSPNASVLSANVLLSTNGTASISIPPSLIGGNYYIAVYHRNSLETWSSSAIAITGNTSFDFTTSSSQAYGTASMKQVEAGVWALYSGDHNQDGAITPSDLGSVAAEASLFSFGYIKTDLTGDGAIDGFDLGLADNNSQALLVSSHP